MNPQQSNASVVGATYGELQGVLRKKPCKTTYLCQRHGSHQMGLAAQYAKVHAISFQLQIPRLAVHDVMQKRLRLIACKIHHLLTLKANGRVEGTNFAVDLLERIDGSFAKLASHMRSPFVSVDFSIGIIAGYRGKQILHMWTVQRQYQNERVVRLNVRWGDRNLHIFGTGRT